MDNEEKQKRFESVYSTKVRAGRRRTYFFDVRQTKGEDYYVTLTESTRRFNGEGYDRHKIFLYKEDFNRFLASLQEVIDHVKTELMPDYDYEEYERRQAEWEAKKAEEDAQEVTDSADEGSEDSKEEDAKEESDADAEETDADAEETDADAETEEQDEQEGSEGEDEMSW